MIQAAISDVISPAVATDDPDALFHQRVSDTQKVASFRLGTAAEFGLQLRYQFALCCDLLFVSVKQTVGQRVAHDFTPAPNQASGVSPLMVNCHPHAESELSIVLEQRIAPRRTTAFAIDRVRSRWQIPAVDT